jgi:hypothetical protein
MTKVNPLRKNNLQDPAKKKRKNLKVKVLAKDQDYKAPAHHQRKVV